MFHIGQEVVFVGGTGKWRTDISVNPPQSNIVYTIKDIRWLDTDHLVGLKEHHITLNELCIGHNAYGVELATPASHFRPIQKKKTQAFWTEGAPKDSEKFDNRHKIKEKA